MEHNTRGPKREKRRSSRTQADREEDENHRSHVRGSDSSRHKRSDKLEGDRKRTDGEESSKKRSSRRRRDDESRKDGDTRSSSRGHGKDSDRRENDGESTRAHGREAEHGHRRSKQSQGREERGRDDDGSRGRHRGRGHDEPRRSSAHGGRDGSDPAQSPKEGGNHSTRVATDDDSEAGVDGWVSVSPGRKTSSSSSRDQAKSTTVTPKGKGKRDKDVAGEYSSEGGENLPQPGEDGGRIGRGRVTEEQPPEALISTRKGIDMSPSRRGQGGREGKHHMAPTTVETIRDVEKPMDQTGEKGLFAASGQLENVRGEREHTRNALDTGRGADRSISVQASTRSWNDNDLEVLYRDVKRPT